MTDTITKIMAFHRNATKPKHSQYLSMKDVGGPCRRMQWYNFRWATKPQQVEGRIARLFKRGLDAEERITKELKATGHIVLDVDANGKQIFLRGKGILGHLVGARDALVLGFAEVPENTWVLADYKTSSRYNFDLMKSGGVKSVHPEYITQIQLYMGYSKREWGAILVECKDNDHMLIEFHKFDPELFNALRFRAKSVIESPIPPVRDCKRDAFFSPCKYCKHVETCYGERMPDYNCRTCIHATPIEDGKWYCEFHKAELSKEQQAKACRQHLFVPELLVAYEPLHGDDTAITYQNKATKETLVNATDPNVGFHSFEIANAEV